LPADDVNIVERGFLKQAEGDVPVSELCREYGMSSASFYKWRAKFGGMDASLITEMKDILSIAELKGATAFEMMWRFGARSSQSISLVVACLFAVLAAVFEPIAFAVHLNDMNVMGQTIQQSGRNVGRSTLYQRYQEKDAVRLDSMNWILLGLAGSLHSTSPSDALAELLDHIFGSTTTRRIEYYFEQQVKNWNAR
jgi:hypothetical protein